MAPVEEEDRSPLLRESQDDISLIRDDTAGKEGGGKEEEEEEDGSPPETAVYARRWYVLFVFCLLAVTQGWMWNTWGPVSDSATLVFGWTNAEIGLFATLGNAAYSLTVFGAAYIMDTLGLRKASLAMAAMLLVGAAVRCVTSHKIVLFWMSVVSAIMSGVAGTVTFSGPALFSAVWFPASQRATANAIINAFNFLGVSVSFLIGPAMVHYVNPGNGTGPGPDTLTVMDLPTDRPRFPHWTGQEVRGWSLRNTSDNHTESVIKKQTEEIMLYLYVQAGFAGFLLLLVLVYFPAKPPLPPSVSASTTRLDFRKGLWELTKNRSFWLLALAYSIPAGLFGVWGSVLNANLGPIGVTQAQAGQIGLYYNLAGGVAGLGVSRVSDLLAGHMKQILVVLYVLAAGALWWIIMLAEQYIPFNLPSLFVSAILASIFINSGVALFYELSSEMCYPVAEGIIGGYLTLLNNIVGIIFLCILFVPHIGSMWMNWTMFVGTLAALPMLFLVKAKYQRLQLDTAAGDRGASVQA